MEQDKEIKRLQKKIDKAIEYMTSYESCCVMLELENINKNKNLDRETMIEMMNRHLNYQNNTLKILKGSDKE